MNNRNKFKMRWYHRRLKYWLKRDRTRPPSFRERPEVVRFDPVPGVAASDKPPVRIFLGTEPLQARAERVFLWSVKAVRDPARAYEIYLMKDLAGFDRDGWTTGFTNYRYSIPKLADEKGRGIYNDVDQIYLADPSPMFDLDMGGAGILCISNDDTSVSLIDCARMAPHWRVSDAQSGHRRGYFLNIIAENKLWGRLAPEWNARDEEYEAGRSKCFHFTTLRTQPWRPFTDQLRYEDHADGDVWFRLERDADAARFNAFSRERPSSRFAAASAEVAEPASAAHEARHAREIGKLAALTGSRAVLDWSARAEDGKPRAWTGLSVQSRDAAAPPFATPVAERFDGVASIDALSAMPEDDVAWLLDELFAAAEKFVYVAVTIDRAKSNGRSEPLPADWWRLQLELAANRNPGRRWTLNTIGRGMLGTNVRHGEASEAKAA